MENIYERIGFYSIRVLTSNEWKEKASIMLKWYKERVFDDVNCFADLDAEEYIFDHLEDCLINSMANDYSEDEYDWYDTSKKSIWKSTFLSA